MLDTTTKRRIDSCRDILVGKVPDPKSQVEQITIALIYKFMDDMDQESEEVGGVRSFFTDEFAQFSWSNVMKPGLGGHEMLELYASAIQRMNENPGIPELFANIFKNAFLPYRDPETLRSFLKEINNFTYDHSERLGDAFEYLLAVLGSQGDAGQFRTPRHIIDFMVEVINPQKDELILDPACGTAGFLVSSYKHIIKHNSNSYLNRSSKSGSVVDDSVQYNGDRLKPNERRQIANNLCGYDISPDMVRLSLVNLYLHGFNKPQISEYDTLTSEDNWKQFSDVILANPPFMSPRGGIKPHGRFSVKSNRSEVLFVDYIAEHLTAKGRAAVVVPEGIIFQSQKAYKQLRKLLVRNSLVAVVSLPAGVFNPYSGVKTSILILNKTVAKLRDAVLFVKIENDGFGLGAQRRAIEKNDLPAAAAAIAEFLQSGDVVERGNVLAVSRERIGANGEWNLSGERYQSNQKITSIFDYVKIGDVFKTSSGGTPLKDKSEFYEGGKIPWIKSGEVAQGFIYESKEFITEEGFVNSSAKLFPTDTVLIAMYGAAAGQVGLLKFEASTNQAVCGIYPSEKALPEYLFYLLRTKREYFVQISSGGAQPNISQSIIRNLEIPLPPIEIQQEIVAEIEDYQTIIDGARQVVENYKPRIYIDPEWPMMALDGLVDFVSGLTVSIPECEDEHGIPIIAINNVTEEGELTLDGLRKIIPPAKTLNYLKSGDLLFNWRNGSKRLVGKTAFFDLEGDYLFASFLIGIRPKPEYFNNRFLWYLLNIYRVMGMYQQFMRQNVNGLFNREELKITQFPMPSIPVQEQIVTELEHERMLINANKELIRRFEDKIKRVINRVWTSDQ